MMANDNPQDDASAKGAVFQSLLDDDLDKGDNTLDNTNKVKISHHHQAEAPLSHCLNNHWHCASTPPFGNVICKHWQAVDQSQGTNLICIYHGGVKEVSGSTGYKLVLHNLECPINRNDILVFQLWISNICCLQLEVVREGRFALSWSIL
jgi:hypothetical protein